jgi:hypothetical protein
MISLRKKTVELANPRRRSAEQPDTLQVCCPGQEDFPESKNTSLTELLVIKNRSGD